MQGVLIISAVIILYYYATCPYYAVTVTVLYIMQATDETERRKDYRQYRSRLQPIIRALIKQLFF